VAAVKKMHEQEPLSKTVSVEQQYPVMGYFFGRVPPKKTAKNTWDF
jgi:hypothetical protein